MSVHLPTALPGCVLRPWRAADRVDLIRHANNRRVWRNMTHTFPHPYTDRDADLWLAIAADPGASLQLAIEVDGSSHGNDERAGHDVRRDAWLKAQGVRVVRVPATWVLKDAGQIAERSRVLAEAMIARRKSRQGA